MLRKRTWYRIYSALFLLLLIWVATFGAWSGMTAGQSPQQRTTSNLSHQRAEEGSPQGEKEKAGWIWRAADDPLAFFTLLLVFVGAAQVVLFYVQLSLIRSSLDDAKTAADAAKEAADAARVQTEIARDEFIATHRPEIVIHSVEFILDAPDDAYDPPIGASIVYFNKGTTPARIVAITATITRRELPLQSGFIIMSTIAAPEDKIAGGGKAYMSVSSRYSLNTVRTIRRPVGAPESIFICVGKILYEDDRRVSRETGFCRRLDANSQRWMRMEAIEYEYAY